MATKKSKSQIPAAGVALAAAAAAGASYYFYGSKGAKRHRQAAVKWAAGMKREVVRDAKKVQKLSKPAIDAVVDRVAKGYAAAKKADPEELARAANELKRNWQMVAKELKDAGGFAAGTKRAKKSAKKKSAKRPAKRRVAKKRR